jgi:C4-dicarboxylate transporter DctQ subunit
MQHLTKWFPRGAEFIAAAMLAAMFATFLLQIFSRYVLMTPFGWTLELCLTLWVWIVFFGNAFIVRDRDHVTFDIFYLAAPQRVRQILAIISAAAVLIGMLWALLPTWDYIDWLKIRKSATLKIPLRTIFSIYAVFMVAVAIRYAWRIVDVIRNGPPDDAHAIVAGEEE